MRAMLALVVLVGLAAREVEGQPGHPGWYTILEKDSVAVAFTYHVRANNISDGAVIYLQNRADRPRTFAFTLVFRGERREATRRVTGCLAPGEHRTGDEAGLFWIPFGEDEPVFEIGLRAYRFALPAGREACPAAG